MKKIISILIIAVLGLAAAEPSQADGWRSPHAVTLWWVIFNNPEQCTFNPTGEEKCGSVDVFGQPYLDSIAAGHPDPTLIAPNLDSGVAVIFATGSPTKRGGRVRLVASIYRTAPVVDIGAETIIDPLGLGRALDNPDAEIHLIVRDHGDVFWPDVDAQILNFLDPYCVDPLLGVGEGPNVCADAQVAVFGRGQEGKKDVISLAPEGGPVRRASATLIRNGDAVQAFVDTRLNTRQ